MNERTRAAHFLLELMIAIALFAVCAAVCIWLFFEAFTTANDARDLNYALIAAKNAAETCKAYGRPEEQVIYYDANWRTSDEAEAMFVLYFTALDDLTVSLLYELKVDKKCGEEIIAFPVGVR